MKLTWLAMVLALGATTVTAQVTDGSYWTDGAGTTATADVTDGPAAADDTVTVTDATGFTDPLPATMASGSTADKPKAQSSGSGETNGNPGNEYRVRAGVLQKKNSQGKWVNMRKTKKPKSGLEKPTAGATADGSPEQTVGNEGTSLPGGPQPL